MRCSCSSCAWPTTAAMRSDAMCPRMPARMRLAVEDRFLMDYFSWPPEGGQPLLSYAR